MENNNFKVFFLRKNVVFTIIMGVFMQLFGAFIFVYTNKHVVGIIALCFLMVFSLFLVLCELFYKVEVFENKIKVRTYFGRKYEFKMSDISLIECDRSDSMESGTHFYIIVKTQKETLHLTGTMIGFDKMSEYLLNKLNTGEIDPNAISCECQETLIQYKNKAYIPKKGR